MHQRIACWIFVLLCAGQSLLHGQDFKVLDRDVQIHGFASQGFVHTSDNNWLTMYTSHFGSGEFTEFGANASMQVTDQFRIGAQIYDRNLGGIGTWHPALDWAYAQYKWKPWLGIRAGRVKTVVGLYNDTQDLDFLHTFALMPQSIYPIDIRDTSIAHDGGDIFGSIPLGGKRGTLSYTAWGGNRDYSQYGGVAYLIRSDGLNFNSVGGLQYGGDLRWNTPLKGLLVGVSRMNVDNTLNYSLNEPGIGTILLQSKDNADWTNQYYGQYTWGKLLVDAEYRRSWDDSGTTGISRFQEDSRGWYFAGSYQILKRVRVGSYYSHYFINFPMGGVEQAGTGHDYDKVVSGRVDINRYVNLKIEGHFMDGYGLPGATPNGFYFANNPQGLKPNTNALVVKGGFNF